MSFSYDPRTCFHVPKTRTRLLGSLGSLEKMAHIKKKKIKTSDIKNS